MDKELLKANTQRSYELYLNGSDRRKIILFFKSPIYGQYGINTYLHSILTVLPKNDLDIIVCYLDALRRDFFLEKDYAVFSFQRLNYTGTSNCQEKLSKSIYYFLASKIGYGKNVVCHFNLYGFDDLMKLFKEKMNAKIIFTVHYTSWGLNYRGNIEVVENLLHKPEEQLNKNEQEILRLMKEEKESILSSDYVIAPSLFTVDHLLSIYNIRKSNIIYIPHFVESVTNKVMRSQNEIRLEYGFDNNHKIILFVGRLDDNKGLECLISVFTVLHKQIASLRLIIAGDGDFNNVLRFIPNQVRESVIFVGFVEKRVLSELFKISDIGVVPSYYEEFGYTAVEMLTAGMPVVCSDTSGLTQLKLYSDRVYFFRHDVQNKGFLNIMEKILTMDLREKDSCIWKLGKDIIKSNFLIKMKNIYKI